MKKLLLTASSSLLLASAASQAFAYDGVITFNGTVTAETCTISAAGGTNNGTVTLPTVATSALAKAADTAGSTQFTIALSNCSGAAKQAAAWFESGSNVNPATGRLINTGTASNVDVALYNIGATNPINVGQGNGFGTSGSPFNITGSAGSATATLNYQAKYYATAAATAGSVVASVNYTIQYQ